VEEVAAVSESTIGDPREATPALTPNTEASEEEKVAERKAKGVSAKREMSGVGGSIEERGVMRERAGGE
jgi:hypothetical protein